MVRVGNVPTVSAYQGNIGQRLMQVGDRLEGISQEYENKQKKELAEAKKMYAQGLNVNLYNSINELRNDPKLSSNPQGLASAMDKVLEKTLADVDDEDVKLDVMVDYQLKKGTYINHAQAEFNRIQRENARSYAFDTIYANIDAMQTSLANALSGNYTEDDIANYQHSIEKLKRNINARDVDGTYLFSDAQRRSYAESIDKLYVNAFKDAYNNMNREQKKAVFSKLNADYYNIPISKLDFEYRGNIDLMGRPIYKNEDGTVSSEKSISFQDDDGKEVIIPTIRTENGKRVDMTIPEAIDWYHKTGEHLGKYDSVEEAEKASMLIHERGEGISLREIVGDKAYKQIKESINTAKTINEEKAYDFLNSDATNEQKVAYINEQEYEGNISEKFATRARRILKSERDGEQTTLSDAESINSILQQASDLINTADSDAEYLVGLKNLKQYMFEMQDEKKINSKDAVKLWNQVSTLTRNKTAEATRGVSWAFDDAKELINESLPPESRAEAVRELFYATDGKDLDKVNLREKATDVIQSIKNKNRARVVQKVDNIIKEEKVNKTTDDFFKGFGL